MSGDASQPATKADLIRLQKQIGLIVQQQLAAAKQEWLEDIKRYFDVTVENIRHDLQGANADEISLVGNTLNDHERRLTTVEKLAGTV